MTYHHHDQSFSDPYIGQSSSHKEVYLKYPYRHHDSHRPFSGNSNHASIHENLQLQESQHSTIQDYEKANKYMEQYKEYERFKAWMEQKKNEEENLQEQEMKNRMNFALMQSMVEGTVGKNGVAEWKHTSRETAKGI